MGSTRFSEESRAARERQVRRLSSRPVSDPALARAVRSLVSYLREEEEADFLEGDHTAQLRKHIFGAVVIADAWLQERRARARREAEQAAARDKALDELETFAESLKIRPEDLDDAVHDAMSAEAADIDNSGLRDQLDCLLNSFDGDVAKLKAFLNGGKL